MNTETTKQFAAHVAVFQRFYGTQPANPHLIEIEDLRTEKTRGKSPVTLRFGFNFENKEDYLAWVKSWKEIYRELAALTRKARAASGAACKRHGLAPDAQNRADDAESEAWSNYNKANEALRFGFFTAFPAETYFKYNLDHKEIARLLLSLRKAAKIDSARRRQASVPKVAAPAA